MKKLITLLATATLAMSTVAFAADDASSNNGANVAPAGSNDKAVVADASGEKPEAMQMGQDAANKSMDNAEKPMAAKKHHHKHKHHHHHHHHAKKDAGKDMQTSENQPQTQETQPATQTQQ